MTASQSVRPEKSCSLAISPVERGSSDKTRRTIDHTDSMSGRSLSWFCFAVDFKMLRKYLDLSYLIIPYMKRKKGRKRRKREKCKCYGKAQKSKHAGTYAFLICLI